MIKLHNKTDAFFFMPARPSHIIVAVTAVLIVVVIGDTVILLQPTTKINETAPLRTKRPVMIVFRIDGCFTARRAFDYSFHENVT